MENMSPEGRNWKRILLWTAASGLVVLALVSVIAVGYLGWISRRIDRTFETLRDARSTQFYAVYPAFELGKRLSLSSLKNLLREQGYVPRPGSAALSPGEYQLTQRGSEMNLRLFRPPFEKAGYRLPQLQARLSFEFFEGSWLLSDIVRYGTGESLEKMENLPKRLGSFYAGRLKTQEFVPLSEIPASARFALMAIEDIHFLEHHGVSLRGTARALWEDIKAMKFVQGGSTLTQQLMKNLFFTREKAVSRKIKEAIYAFVAEQRQTKEAILEGYLNEVYMGQWGTRQIHGYSEGAQYYFSRSISQLTLAQSALLAAIVQAPNAMDPYRNPERSLDRRNLVLRKMRDASFILESEYQTAIAEPLSVVPQSRSSGDVYYAIDLVLERLPSEVRSRMDTEPLTLYVTINPFLQGVASETLRSHLEWVKSLIPTKEGENTPKPQAALVAVNPRNCTVLAVQGGSNYRQTQFNRVIQGRRQPGSLFKPFVYLAGFASHTDQTPFTPLTELEDTPLVWEYDNQSWSPENYDREFRGKVTVRAGLEKSINVPTARVAQRVGVDRVQDVIVRAGVRSPVPKVPSIALGSAEVTPLELAEAYTTVANLGRYCKLRPYLQVFDENGNQVSKTEVEFTRTLPEVATFQTVQLMKGVVSHGTGRWAARIANLPAERFRHFAGKTGTTNNGRDAWFVGFSPDLLVLVWVGLDQGKGVGLTGSKAALPLWAKFVGQAQMLVSDQDFPVPENMRAAYLDRDRNDPGTCQDVLTEYFVRGTEPSSECPAPEQASLQR